MRRYARDAEDARRSAHNPEVAGSNPAPVTKAWKAGSRTGSRPFGLRFVKGSLNVSRIRPRPRRPGLAVWPGVAASSGERVPSPDERGLL